MQKEFKYYFLLLVLINLLFFIFQLLFANFTDFGVLNENALKGQYYRFVTSMFLHSGIIHLSYNMFALALFGFILEKRIGSNKFLLVYFLSGIIANLVAVNFYSSSLGASGAIYGILGVLVILMPMMMIWAFGFPMPMFLAGIFWVLAGIFGLFIPSNTGHIAHLSGIAVGFVIGIALRIKGFRNVRKEKMHIVPESEIRNWERRYFGK